MSRVLSAAGRAGPVIPLLLVALACGKDPLAPADRLEPRMESAHFLYLSARGDQPVDTAYQERHLAWVSQRRTFYEYGEQLTYPVAGSFVTYLLEAEGVDDFKAFVRAGESPTQELSRTRARFLEAYGFSLEAARDRWLAFLEARE